MDITHHKTLAESLVLFFGCLVFLLVSRAVYNVYFHPLRNFPGHWTNKISIVSTKFRFSVRLHH